MIGITSEDARTGAMARLGSQPLAVASVALIVMLVGIGFVAMWRSYTGTSPEQERAAAVVHQLQARAAQVSAQFVEKTKGLEATQEEQVDQLQLVQDQLQTTRRQLAAQQAESKRLAEQVTALSEAVESLRQSFASAPSADSANSPSRHAARPHHVFRVWHRKHAKSAG
jgi:Tfp pilus assembly protein FimV